MKDSSKLKILGIDLTGMMSKDQECIILDALHLTLLGTGNYIEPLFSADAVDMYKNWIRADFLVDPLASMKALEEERNTATTRVRELESELAKVRGELVESKMYADKLRDGFSVATEVREEKYQDQMRRNRDLWREVNEYRQVKSALRLVLDSINLEKKAGEA